MTGTAHRPHREEHVDCLEHLAPHAHSPVVQSSGPARCTPSSPGNVDQAEHLGRPCPVRPSRPGRAESSPAATASVTSATTPALTLPTTSSPSPSAAPTPKTTWPRSTAAGARRAASDATSTRPPRKLPKAEPAEADSTPPRIAPRPHPLPDLAATVVAAPVVDAGRGQQGDAGTLPGVAELGRQQDTPTPTPTPTPLPTRARRSAALELVEGAQGWGSTLTADPLGVNGGCARARGQVSRKRPFDQVGQSPRTPRRGHDRPAIRRRVAPRRGRFDAREVLA